MADSECAIVVEHNRPECDAALVTNLRLVFVDVEANKFRYSWIGWEVFERTMKQVSEEKPVPDAFWEDAERLVQYWEQPRGRGMRVHT